MNIGIIGQGFVGSAIREGLKNFYTVYGYDIDRFKCHNMENVNHENRLEYLVNTSDIIFACLPTPMRKDGTCDTRILQTVLKKVHDVVKKTRKLPRHSDFLSKLSSPKTVVIKSTIEPGTTERLAAEFRGINICFSPEFLTEANSFNDFKNQSRILIGGDGAKIVKQMFRKPFPDIPIVITQPKTAEMVKYFINCFLATKVTFANQMYEICDKTNIDYDKVCEYALYDNRIGKSHLAVPGPDGDRGFGGHCFPKDLSALIVFAKENQINPYFLENVERSNLIYRQNKDWEEMKGRAVSDD
jgi:UDPglucose 6-dehydrogenase